MEEMEKKNEDELVRLMIPDDDDWPELLDEIPQPPRRLFVRGSWPPRFPDGTAVNGQTKFLCVIGARRHSEYGYEACRTLMAGLAGYNICIVSGLALGLDAVAHEAALTARLATIAFPGSGLSADVLYPPRNTRLAKRIIDSGGALLSEYDMDTVAAPWCFPQRNRLMAGISHATLVIEAKCPSGTIITSSLANDYCRDVFTVPGDIFSPLSAGPHMLIRRGAALVRNSEDILHELGIKTRDETKDGGMSPAAQIGLFNEIRGETDDERIIYKIILDGGGKMHRDEIIRVHFAEHSSNISEISATLSIMEMNGLITEKNGLIKIIHERM